MNTEKLEKLKKSLNNNFIPDNMKDKIRAEIKKLESEIKTDETITAKEVKEEIKEIEEKVEKALDVAEKKEEAQAKATRKPRQQKPTVSRTKKQKVEPKATAKKKTVFSLAKEIRKDDETWEQSKQRASKMMKSGTTETKKKVRTETSKLLATIRRKKELKGILGKDLDLSRDNKRTALPRGKRISKNGKVYYENRDNHSDRLAPNYKDKIYLSEGGGVNDKKKNKELEDVIELQPLEISPLSTQLNKLSGYNWTDGNWESESGGKPSTKPNSVIVNVHTKQKFRLSPYYIFKGKDHKNENDLYRVEDMSEDGEYVGEWHDKQEDAKDELKGLAMTYSKGGALTNERRHVNKSEDYEVRYSKDKPRRTGYKGKRSFDNGGGVGNNLSVVKVKFKNPKYNYTTNMSASISEQDAKKYFIGKTVNVGDYPKENMQEVVDIQFYPAGTYKENGGSLTLTPETPLARGLDMDYTGLVGETGGMSSGEMFMAGGSVGQMINFEDWQLYDRDRDLERMKKSCNAIRKNGFKAIVVEDKDMYYVLYKSMSDSKGKRVFSNGGGIENQYEGKTAKEVWNMWTLDQREHFLADHYDVLMGNDLASKNKKFENLANITQMQLELHISQGQYANGGGVDGNEVIKLKVIQEGDFLINYNDSTITFPSGKTFKVVEDREHYIKIEKTQIKAIRGIKGLSDFLKELNKPNTPFRSIANKLINLGKDDKYAMGGSLGNHGLKQGDQIIKTMSGGIQKIKTKSGDIVYVNLADGYRGDVPPLPFSKGGALTNERKHVNKSEDYEVRYSKDKPKRTGYKGKRSFDNGGEMPTLKTKKHKND